MRSSPPECTIFLWCQRVTSNCIRIRWRPRSFIRLENAMVALCSSCATEKSEYASAWKFCTRSRIFFAVVFSFCVFYCSVAKKCCWAIVFRKLGGSRPPRIKCWIDSLKTSITFKPHFLQVASTVQKRSCHSLPDSLRTPCVIIRSITSVLISRSAALFVGSIDGLGIGEVGRVRSASPFGHNFTHEG